MTDEPVRRVASVVRRLRRWQLAKAFRKTRASAIRACWGFLEPAGFGLIVYATWRWQELLGIALGGCVLIGYGAIRGR